MLQYVIFGPVGGKQGGTGDGVGERKWAGQRLVGAGLDSPVLPWRRGASVPPGNTTKHNLAKFVKGRTRSKGKTQEGNANHGRDGRQDQYRSYWGQGNVLKTCWQFMIRYVNHYHYRRPPWTAREKKTSKVPQWREMTWTEIEKGD